MGTEVIWLQEIIQLVLMGLWVEDGIFKYPVSEITIAGNFKDIFKNITLADDLEFKYSTTMHQQC